MEPLPEDISALAVLARVLEATGASNLSDLAWAESDSEADTWYWHLHRQVVPNRVLTELAPAVTSSVQLVFSAATIHGRRHLARLASDLIAGCAPANVVVPDVARRQFQAMFYVVPSWVGELLGADDIETALYIFDVLEGAYELSPGYDVDSPAILRMVEIAVELFSAQGAQRSSRAAIFDRTVRRRPEPSAD